MSRRYGDTSRYSHIYQRPHKNRNKAGWTRVETHPLNVDQRSTLVVHELSGKLGTLLRVDTSDVLKKLSVVGLVVDSLRVQDLFVFQRSGAERCRFTKGMIRGKGRNKNEG